MTGSLSGRGGQGDPLVQRASGGGWMSYAADAAACSKTSGQAAKWAPARPR
ncbi:hypothetical protein [Streptomyces vastus]|uniref:hypothetical protein n=1 Tax=Streptomyces vastus TaxID=285451 RepID=UPI0031DA2E8C